MEFQDVVRRRRMVRNFDDRPIDADVVDRLLANAVRAPSAGFTQGWAFLVLEGPEQTGRFWEASSPPGQDGARRRWPGVLRAPLIVVCLVSERAYRDRYAEADKAHTDIGAVPWWYVDTGFAALLLLLTAVDAGLGALFFGVADPEGVRAGFGVPADHMPVGAVAIGHPLPHEPSASLARGRRPLDEVVHRGRW
ncbi:MAG TPA: nitroreductase family protein [Acidimicrobiales bacterium]|nr:nitroreductase family protein [Acidimicrobiales bacterium]